MILRLLITALLFQASSLKASTPPGAFIIELMAKSFLSNKTRFKAIITQDDNYFLLDLNKDNTLSINQPSPLPSLKLGILDELMSSSSKTKIIEYLNMIHVDIEVVGLGLFANEPVYILGASTPNSMASQLWINKNSLLPVKELSSEQEIIFEKWQLLSKQKAKFPRLITKKTASNRTVISMAEVD